MKVYAIFANDKINGTTYKLFNQAIQCFQSLGNIIDILHLYDREKEIPFFHHNQSYMESHPFYIENKQRFLDADTLLFTFPLFWYGVPGILKTWIDMINSWAYKYEAGLYVKPLHNIKNVFIIYASMQDKQHLQNVLHNPVEQQLSETFKFIGINNIHTYIVDKVTTLKPEEIDQHLEQIKKLCLNIQ